MADDHTPSDEFLKAMALVILEWARAEHVIEWSLAELTHGSAIEGPDDAGFVRLLINNTDARTMAGLLKVMFRARFFADADAFDRLVDRLMKERPRRDVIAHGRWRAGSRPRSYAAVTFKSVGRLGVETHEFTPEELRSLADRVHRKAREVAHFLNARGYWKTPASLQSLNDVATPAAGNADHS